MYISVFITEHIANEPFKGFPSLQSRASSKLFTERDIKKKLNEILRDTKPCYNFLILTKSENSLPKELHYHTT